MNRSLLVFVCLTASMVSAYAQQSPPTIKNTERPNVLVVMVDDLGFSDIGCYGGEVETPTLDRLAAGGLRFSQFYNTAKCHSSRISLLTGCYAIQAGNESMRHAVTSAEVLGSAGYFTAMTGKWHLANQPTDFGFSRYFGHLSGACNYFRGDKTFRLNGRPWEVPKDGFYTTVADIDFALRFLEEARETKKPWYLYVAFNAPHAPLHALEKDYKKYIGRYDVGWDRVRDDRIAKQKELGVIDSDSRPSPRPSHVPAWRTLSQKRRDWESRRMTALAAMIDRVDQELGRLVGNLEQHEELENTLILFVSDNGACPYDRRSTNLAKEPTDGSFTWSDSTGWAWCRNAPFRFYKQNQFEGGISTPAIVHWPAGLKTPAGAIVDQPAHLVDVLPTLSEICQAPIPDRWPDRELRPIAGISLVDVFAGRSLKSRPPIHLLFSSDRGLRDGDWKVVSFRGQPWELYRMDRDRAETKDLSALHPQRLNEMTAQWTQMAEQTLHAPARSYAPVTTTSSSKSHPEWTDFTKEPSPGNGKAGQPKKFKSQSPKAQRLADTIRARKFTKMIIADGEIQLTCTGLDPGIAIDVIQQPIESGPYRLSFEVKSSGDTDGEVYFTVDMRTKLPQGDNVKFTVVNDKKWHPVTIDLNTQETIRALRLDVCGGIGNAAIRGLELRTPDGKTLRTFESGK